MRYIFIILITIVPYKQQKKICAVYGDGAIAEIARFKRGNLIWNVEYVSEKSAIFDDQIETLIRIIEITRMQRRRDTPRMSYEHCKIL